MTGSIRGILKGGIAPGAARSSAFETGDGLATRRGARMRTIRCGIIVKLVQLGALDRSWRKRVFKPGGGKNLRWSISLNREELDEVKKALEHIRYNTAHTLEHNQTLYANRIYGGRLFKE